MMNMLLPTIRVIDESGKNERAAVKSLVGGTF